MHSGSLIFLPHQLSHRADLYHQLGQMTAAGVTLTRGLEQLRDHPPDRSYRRPIEAVLQHIADGHTFSAAAENAGPWLPQFDLALLQAAEKSGRLDACFRLLSDYYQDRARVARQLMVDSAYPVLLLHLGVFVFAFVSLVRTGNGIAFLAQTLGPLAVLYSLVAAAVYLTQSGHSESWRARVESVLRPIPVLGGARHHLALARLAAALEALLSAGVSIVEAWELAAAASGSTALRRIVVTWRPLIDAGQTPAELVASCGWFPEMFASQYATGEVSGQLDGTLRRMHRYYQEEGSQKMHLLVQWLPRLVYFAVALGIAFKVIQFWSAHFNDIGAAGKF